MYHIIKGYFGEGFRHNDGGQYDTLGEAQTAADRAVKRGYDWALVIYIWLEAGSPCASTAYRVVRGRGDE